jgi:inositol phosphorylceramide mannosyltransferase catalytic subunit
MIWLGGAMPDEYRRFAGSWVRHHSRWEFTLWGERELAVLPMRNRELYGLAEKEAPTDAIRWRVDIARLEILHRFGGIYVDADTECLRPLDPLLQHHMFLPQSPNDTRYVTNAVMGAGAGHPFLDALVEGLPANADAYRGQRLVDSVGGKYITRQIGTLKPTGVAILPWWLFAAQSIRDRDRGLAAKPHPDAYTNHRYANSRGRRRR